MRKVIFGCNDSEREKLLSLSRTEKSGAQVAQR